MAGYGYRSSSSPQTDEWRKTSYAASDHDVCRPVIGDGEGRKRPIVSFTPTNQNSEYYVTRTTETVVQEQINLSPYASEMKQPPPLWAPEGHQGVVEDKWQKHPNACPPKVDEFVTRPKFGPMNASTWRQTAKPSGGYGSEFHDYNNSDKKQHTSNNGYLYDGNNNYYSNYNKEPLSPVGTHASPPHYRHADPILIDTYDIREATPVITHGGWVRPTATTTTWASPPNSNLTKPTSDIPTVIGILKEVAKPFISTAVYADEPGGGRYTQTMDSKEAAARYGNFGKFKSSPKTTYTTDNNYATTIDSREAARKYHGATV